MGLAGVKVGPLDPDATESFGQVSQKNSARQLIRLHHQQHPPQLLRALAKKLDEPRTKALDLDEVRKYVGGLEHDNGDPYVPEGSKVVAAQVRGEDDQPKVLTFTYLLKSGRTGKWFAEYDRDELPESADAGNELAKVKEMKDRGIVAFDSEGTERERLARENAALRREAKALRDVAEGKSKDRPPKASAGDTRPDDQIVAENEDLRREAEELRARVAQFESLEAAQQGGTSLAGASETVPPTDSVASADPPVEGYDKLKAEDVKKLLRSEGTSPGDAERIIAYERTHANRRSVIGVAESKLDRG